MKPCVFCRPEPERVFYRSQHCVALWSKYEVAPGHALVIPLRHVASYFDLYAFELHDMHACSLAARDEVRKRFGKVDGYNVGFNVGAAAGQTIQHAHMHVIPRRAGDVEDPTGGIRNVIPGKGNYLKSAKP